MAVRVSLWEKYVMAYLTRNEFAIRSKTKTDDLRKETEKSMENQPYQQAGIDSPSTSHQAGATHASPLTPCQGLATYKFIQQMRQKNCLAVSPQELREHLTESEIAALQLRD